MGSSLALSGLSKTKQRLQKGEKTFLCGIVGDGEGGKCVGCVFSQLQTGISVV